MPRFSLGRVASAAAARAVLDDVAVGPAAEVGQGECAETAPATPRRRLPAPVRPARGGRPGCSRRACMRRLPRTPARRRRGGGRLVHGSLASSSVQSQGSVRSRHAQTSDRASTNAAASSRSRCWRARRHADRRLGSSRRRTASASGSRSVVWAASIQAVSSTAQRSKRCSRGAVLAGRGQPVEPERPDRLEHAVAGPILERCVDHGCVDEVGQRASWVAGEAELGGDVFGGGEVDSVGEHRQVPEQPPLVGGEELVGPLEGRAQRPVSGFGCRRAAAEEVERAVQPLGEVDRGRTWTAVRRRARWPAVSRRAVARCRRRGAARPGRGRTRAGPGRRVRGRPPPRGCVAARRRRGRGAAPGWAAEAAPVGRGIRRPGRAALDWSPAP